MTDTLGIPPEIALGVPKATLIGTALVQIENHGGLCEYTPRRVRVRAEGGEIIITGSRLRIGSIFQREMVVEGHITGLEFPQAGREP